MKIIYHVKNKKNLCGASSDNSIIKDKKTLKDIEEIIEYNSKFIRLCKKCRKIMKNLNEN